MPAAFSASVLENKLDDFVLAVRRKTSRDVTDIITPSHAIFRRMEAQGAIMDESPGQNPVRDVMFLTPDRSVEMSRSQPMAKRDAEPIEGHTQAQYHWIMCLTTLTIPLWTYHNTTGADAMVNYVLRQQKQLDVQLQNKMVDWLWNGYSLGTDHIWGIKEFVQFTPSSDPARGGSGVGHLSVSNLSTWKNASRNFNDAYVYYDTGAQVRTFLNYGPDSLLSLYLDCVNNPQEHSAEGQPDLLACNEPMTRYLERLVDLGMVFRDNQAAYRLGVDGIRYRSATAYHDRDMPDDPNNSTYGVGMFLNTNTFEWVWATGLKKKWSEKHRMDEEAGYQWDEMSQGTLCVSDRRRNGVIYGVQEAAIAA